jgi:hypothetical protein
MIAAVAVAVAAAVDPATDRLRPGVGSGPDKRSPSEGILLD